MKSVVFGIFFLGFASLGISQEDYNGEQAVELETITLSANAGYLAEVNDVTTPGIVKELHMKAAGFDPRTAREFDPKSKKAFETVFKADNGRLIAAYNPSGQIFLSHARFSNVTLPLAVRQEVFADNEGWQMISNQFMSTYVDDRQTRKKYKIHMQNGERSKSMIVDLR